MLLLLLTLALGQAQAVSIAFEQDNVITCCPGDSFQVDITDDATGVVVTTGLFTAMSRAERTALVQVSEDVWRSTFEIHDVAVLPDGQYSLKMQTKRQCYNALGKPYVCWSDPVMLPFTLADGQLTAPRAPGKPIIRLETR